MVGGVTVACWGWGWCWWQQQTPRSSAHREHTSVAANTGTVDTCISSSISSSSIPGRDQRRLVAKVTFIVAHDAPRLFRWSLLPSKIDVESSILVALHRRLTNTYVATRKHQHSFAGCSIVTLCRVTTTAEPTTPTKPDDYVYVKYIYIYISYAVITPERNTAISKHPISLLH